MRKMVLITGASGGIGYELAKIFAREGYDLVLVARGADRLASIKLELEERYGIIAEILARDLTIKDTAAEIFADLQAEGRQIDILVNNAGFGDFGEFAAADWQKQYDMIQLNVIALMQMTKLFLSPMLARKEGKILNVASIAAFQPGPLMSVYYASKAAVLSFSEALSSEMKGSGVTVTVLCPGPTKTGFVAAASLENSRLFKNMKVTTPDKVAACGYKALMRGQAVAIQGSINQLLVFSLRLAPRSLARELARKVQARVE